MANYFIIHGLYGKPFENWFPWLEQKLSEKKLRCIVPQFPTPVGQSYSNWERLLAYYDNIGFVDKNTVFITHSLGSVFIAKYLLTNKIKVRGIISAAGFTNFTSGMSEIDNLNKTFFIGESDLGNLPNYTDFIHCFISENDPNLPNKKTTEFAKAVNGTIHLIPKGGHFNSAAGYNKFDEIFEIIKQIEEN